MLTRHAHRRSAGPPAERGSLRALSAGIRYTAGVVAAAALYRGAAEVGYALQFAGPVAAIVWLPVGIGAAFLYLGGLRYWPGIVVGDRRRTAAHRAQPP